MIIRKFLLGVVVLCIALGMCIAEEDSTALPGLLQTNARISMDFRDASLKDLLKIISQQSGINFIPSEDVQDKKITLYLENVPIKDAIDSIIEANGLTYEQGPAENIFIVRPSGVVKIKTVTKIYTLNFAQVAPLVAQSVGTSATSGSSSSSGSSNYSATSSGTTSAQTPSSSSSSSGSTIKATGIEDILSKLLTPAGNIVVDQRTNSLIITDIPEQFKVIEEMLVKLDTPTPQVFIEAEIIETTTDVTDKLGLEYGGTSGTWSATYTGPKRDYALPYDAQAFKGHGQTPAFTFGTMSFGDLAFTLKALIASAETKYLARPKLLTLNNETAVIDITSDTYVGQITTSTPQTQTNTTSAERMSTGVSLRVTPQVNAAEYVTMILEPSVSRTEASGVNTDYLNPIKRSTRVKVMVKDGETVFIGGLLDTYKTDTKRKVPILGDIPLAGALFKSDTKTDKQTEILIFITPHIVKNKLVVEGRVVSEQEAPANASREQLIDEAVKELEKKGK